MYDTVRVAHARLPVHTDFGLQGTELEKMRRSFIALPVCRIQNSARFDEAIFERTSFLKHVSPTLLLLHRSSNFGELSSPVFVLVEKF